MNRLLIAGSTAALAVSLGLFTATASFSKSHDQGIGDGSGLNRTLSEVGTSNAGGSGQFIGGKGGISAGVKGGARGAAASGLRGANKGAHGSVAGQVDDAVRNR